MKLLVKLSLMCAVAGASVLALPQTADACGGFFCNAAQPVNQAAERIVFVKNGEDSFRAIVGLAYEGEAEEFAWVLPVEGVPEIGVSSTEFLDDLQRATNPQFTINWTFEDCGFDRAAAAPNGTVADAGSVDPTPEVTVAASGVSGPYDYRVLEVSGDPEERANIAVNWLQESGFDIDAAGNATLQPYLAQGMNLLAIRLTKGATAGDVRPLALDFPGPIVGIPLRPTAVAAVNDMPVMVWVAGEHRAVSNNYVSLEPNYALLNWLNPNSNYNEVIAAAADAAGGQGFVTEYAGDMVSNPERFTDPTDIPSLQNLLWSFNGSPLLIEVMVDHLPEGLSEEEFRECPTCHFNTFVPADEEAFRAQIIEEIYEPYQDAWELLSGQSYLSRLFTTMSPADMDRDPTFVFNADLGAVSNQHTADGTRYCDGSFAVRVGGAAVRGDGGWPVDVTDPSMPANAEVRRMGESGEGTVLENNQSLIDSRLRARFPDPDEGCSASGNGTGGALALLLMLGLVRRRRQR